MENNADDNHTYLELGLGACVWFGGNHDKGVVLCGRVFFNHDKRFQQSVDWTTTEEKECDFENIEQGPLLTR